MIAIYTLTIASKLVGLHPRTIMNYEKYGFIKPQRTPTNQRLFSNEDLKTLLFIKYLREEEKLNIAAINLVLKKNLASFFPKFDPSEQLKKILEEG